MNKQFTDDKQITEQLLYKQAEHLYRDIERYIEQYPLYVDIDDDLIRLKWQLQDLLNDRGGNNAKRY